jgi:S-adenosylmethionine:tRNA ribosyltransferase-isomerase
MLISEFDYELPEALIAQKPLKERANSRMLLIDRAAKTFTDEQFVDLPKFLKKDDVVVLNNTKVFPARLFGTSETGAKIEVFLVRELEDRIWEALARPGKRLKISKKITFGENLTAEVLERSEDGKVFVRFEASGDFDAILDKIGKTPLPPYIKRDSEKEDEDRERYQTVFAREKGAIAAPTAGLHFTPQILEEIKDLGAQLAEITLHIGYGTFEPVRVSDLSGHKVTPESFEIDEKTARILNKAKAEKRRVIAIGTTTTRALESSVDESFEVRTGKQLANLTITPGYKFKIIDGLLTNFHLPRSSLLVLVSTFTGHELIMKAYKHAVAQSYRFYSYGDCMLIL